MCGEVVQNSTLNLALTLTLGKYLTLFSQWMNCDVSQNLIDNLTIHLMHSYIYFPLENNENIWELYLFSGLKTQNPRFHKIFVRIHGKYCEIQINKMCSHNMQNIYPSVKSRQWLKPFASKNLNNFIDANPRFISDFYH